MLTDPTGLTVSALFMQISDLTRTVSGLNRRVDRLERARLPFQSLLPGLDLDRVPAQDKISYGVGYLTAKMAVPPDLNEGEFSDYLRGYDLGRLVAGQEVEPPVWDLAYSGC